MVRAKQRGIIYMHTPPANYIILQLDKYAMMMDKCFLLVNTLTQNTCEVYVCIYLIIKYCKLLSYSCKTH